LPAFKASNFHTAVIGATSRKKSYLDDEIIITDAYLLRGGEPSRVSSYQKK